MPLPYQKIHFLLSVADVSQLPPDRGAEVAIVGRSNSGKSSVLNRLAHNKGLARVSKQPGRTQCINFFGLDDDRRLVDLPGYGYAKVPLATKQKWQKTVDSYLGQRQSLKGLLLVMDVRHPMKPLDYQLLAYCNHYNKPVHVLLNKTDKLSQAGEKAALKKLKSALTSYDGPVTLGSFSALKGTGVKELHRLLEKWLDI